LTDTILTVVLIIDQVNVYIFTVNIQNHLELCMVTRLQAGGFNFWEGQENFLKICLLERYILPFQVRWVRAFS